MKNRKLILSLIGIFIIAILIGISYFFYQEYKVRERNAKEKLDALAAQEALKNQKDSIGKPFDYEKYQKDRNSGIKNEIAKPNPDESLVTEDSKKPAYANNPLKEAGWIPNWDYTAGVNSLKSNGSDFDSISPVWYSPVLDGTLDIKRSGNFRDLIYYGKQNDIKIIPSIASSDPDLLKGILNSPVSLQAHVDALISEVDLYDFDGIDIDYEAFYLDDKEEFFKFLNKLNDKLNERNKLLSIAVLSQWGDNMIYPSLNETRKVQNWAELAAIADQIRIMAYDYHYSGSPVAGPIAPVAWVEEILQYAIKKIPKDKIWLGIHLYSYEWGSNGTAGSYTYDVLANIIGDDPEKLHDPKFAEGYYQYDCDPSFSCQIYFQTKKGVEARKLLAKKYGVIGVTYWRVGREGILLTE